MRRSPSGVLVAVAGLINTQGEEMAFGNVSVAEGEARTLTCPTGEKISGIAVDHDAAVVRSFSAIYCSPAPRPLQMIKNDPITITSTIHGFATLDSALRASPRRQEDPLYVFEPHLAASAIAVCLTWQF